MQGSTANGKIVWPVLAAAAVLLLSAPHAFASRSAPARPDLLAAPVLQPITATSALAPTYASQGFELRLDTDPHPATFALFDDLAPASEHVEPEKLASGVASWEPRPNLQRIQLFVAESWQVREFLGPIDSPNLYQAFGLDPMNMTDPLGLQTTPPDDLCAAAFTDPDEIEICRAEAELERSRRQTLKAGATVGEVGGTALRTAWTALPVLGLTEDVEAWQRGEKEKAVAGIAIQLGGGQLVRIAGGTIRWGGKAVLNKVDEVTHLRGGVLRSGAAEKAAIREEAGSVGKRAAIAGLPQWRVGDPITKLTSGGAYPSWETIRSRYWMNRIDSEPGAFSEANRAIMREGFAPKARVIVRDRKTGQLRKELVEKELHHARGNRGVAGFDEPIELREVWPWEHEKLLPSGRRLDYDFVAFL